MCLSYTYANFSYLCRKYMLLETCTVAFNVNKLNHTLTHVVLCIIKQGLLIVHIPRKSLYHMTCQKSESVYNREKVLKQCTETYWTSHVS